MGSTRARILACLAAVTPLGFASKLYAGPAASWVNGHAGGVLYVIFWILLVALIRPQASPRLAAALVLAVTCLLEVLQLFSNPALAAVRATFLGQALIGSTFSWWDFPHYLLGAVLGVAVVSRVTASDPPALPPLLVAALLSLFASSSVGVWALGSALSAPANRPVGAVPATLPAVPIEIESASGTTLRGWFVRGDAKRGVVVLAHSVRSDRREMLGRAEFLNRAGYGVLLFDAQAHGESPGARITFGHLEALDSRAAVSFVRSELPGAPVAYLGASLGGAAALTGPEPLAVEALILEAVYPSLREAIVNRVNIRLPALGGLLAPLFLAQVEPRIGIAPEELAPIDAIGEVRAPVLVIAGALDRHTTRDESRRLFAAAPNPKQLWIVEGAAHQNLHRFAPEEYERRILEFLEGAL